MAQVPRLTVLGVWRSSFRSALCATFFWPDPSRLSLLATLLGLCGNRRGAAFYRARFPWLGSGCRCGWILFSQFIRRCVLARFFILIVTRAGFLVAVAGNDLLQLKRQRKDVYWLSREALGAIDRLFFESAKTRKILLANPQNRGLAHSPNLGQNALIIARLVKCCLGVRMLVLAIRQLQLSGNLKKN